MTDDIKSPTQSQPPSLGRRGALECMAWAGTGLLWTLSGGLVQSVLLGDAAAAATAPLSFIQISDSHIGFSKPANPDPIATLRETIGRIRTMPSPPRFILHTGDITHLASPEQFDTAQSVFADLGAPIHFIPGEHDMVQGADPGPYLQRFGADTKGEGWYSFDVDGAHFIGLVNVVRLGDRGMGTLGEAQIAWLRDDLAHLSSSTPIIVFSHFPLWDLYADWGWGTADARAALAALRRFGSVTLLNGHVHQVQTKVEGHMTFHSARSTAYPQPAPGVGPGPGPLALPPDKLRAAIGLRTVSRRVTDGPLAVVDRSLADS